MKFVLFVEGQTEHAALPRFLARWLDSRLTKRVGIQTVKFEGWAEFRKKVPRKVRMHLDGPKNEEIVAAIGLLDLYGPTFYPASAATAGERLAAGTALIENEINDGFSVSRTSFLLRSATLCPPRLASLRSSISTSRPRSYSTGSTTKS